jgi:ferredoxin--NADP+ reductase
MGQPLQVQALSLQQVAIFTTDRCLTGQDHELYRSLEEAAARSTVPAVLARRLFQLDRAIEHVFVLSNEVVLGRREPWDVEAVDGAAEAIRGLFVFYPQTLHPPSEPEPAVGVAPPQAPLVPSERVEELRRRDYNATIEEIHAVHPDLWIIRVRADQPLPPFKAGQYTTLALGYWEPRIDDLLEGLKTGQVEKLARRSYSVSSSILGADGDLLEFPRDLLEFYVVLVQGEDPLNLPALTPRLFLKHPGDPIYMGSKFAGRYTLDQVDPEEDVIFMATGTGEAPHNLMTLELLHGGHRGRIASVCCSRYRRDLAYLEVHRRLEERHPRYTYIGFTTREPENLGEKMYVQDLIRSGKLEEELATPLDPDRTHVFLCGNPAMIGLPRWERDEPIYPKPEGAIEVLVKRGFTLDRRGVKGNIHYEEYWKER